jgi:hypothetical protein
VRSFELLREPADDCCTSRIGETLQLSQMLVE